MRQTGDDFCTGEGGEAGNRRWADFVEDAEENTLGADSACDRPKPFGSCASRLWFQWCCPEAGNEVTGTCRLRDVCGAGWLGCCCLLAVDMYWVQWR